MSKAVLISVRPEWCALIVDGRKTIEVRKSKPKLTPPFKCYIYCTKGTELWLPHDNAQALKRGDGKVIGEFVCDHIDKIVSTKYGIEYGLFEILAKSGLSTQELRDYLNGKNAYGWHISNLIIYDKPKDPEDFRVEASNKIWSFTKKLERPPQSWCYVEELTKGGTDNG